MSTNEVTQSLEEPIGNFEQLNVKVSKMRMNLVIQKLQFIESEIEILLDEIQEITQ